MGKFFDRKSIVLGIAIFSMFFGAGNAVFPLVVGVEAKAQCGFAFLGLLMTAVGGPLLGLAGGVLFKGRCIDFFSQAGKIPGAFLMMVTLALLGPFAVLPRCVTVAYAAANALSPGLSLGFFALVFNLLAFLCCLPRQFLLSALGYILSPVLIGCLLVMIYQGCFQGGTVVNGLSESGLRPWGAFTLGFSTGYDTMDLIAAIYFSAGVWNMISLQSSSEPSQILKTTLRSGIVGCSFLGLIYFGLMHAAARFAPQLAATPPEQLIVHLAHLTLGANLSLVAHLAVALACFTTVISLAMAISDVLCYQMFAGRFPHLWGLALILMITSAMAHIGFEAITHLIHPIAFVCYPLIILLTGINVYRKSLLQSAH